MDQQQVLDLTPTREEVAARNTSDTIWTRFCPLFLTSFHLSLLLCLHHRGTKEHRRSGNSQDEWEHLKMVTHLNIVLEKTWTLLSTAPASSELNPEENSEKTFCFVFQVTWSLPFFNANNVRDDLLQSCEGQQCKHRCIARRHYPPLPCPFQPFLTGWPLHAPSATPVKAACDQFIQISYIQFYLMAASLLVVQQIHFLIRRDAHRTSHFKFVERTKGILFIFFIFNQDGNSFLRSKVKNFLVVVVSWWIVCEII